MPCWYVPASVNECHLVNFAQRRDTQFRFGHPAFAKSDHAFLTRDTLDLRGWPPVDNHLANPVGKIQQFADGSTSMVTRAGAFQAACAFTDLGVLHVLGL